MSIFEAYNNTTEEWEIFPISKLSKISKDTRYSLTKSSDKEDL